eukprot:5538765-Lingulodinium_polyedra.AAC.1
MHDAPEQEDGPADASRPPPATGIPPQQAAMEEDAQAANTVGPATERGSSPGPSGIRAEQERG